jgi:hypothetical protein
VLSAFGDGGGGGGDAAHAYVVSAVTSVCASFVESLQTQYVTDSLRQLRNAHGDATTAAPHPDNVAAAAEALRLEALIARVAAESGEWKATAQQHTTTAAAVATAAATEAASSGRNALSDEQRDFLDATCVSLLPRLMADAYRHLSVHGDVVLSTLRKLRATADKHAEYRASVAATRSAAAMKPAGGGDKQKPKDLIKALTSAK